MHFEDIAEDNTKKSSKKYEFIFLW